MSSLNAIRLSKSGRRMLISGLESALLNSGKVKETFLLGELIILTRRSAARNVGLVPVSITNHRSAHERTCAIRIVGGYRY